MQNFVGCIVLIVMLSTISLLPEAKVTMQFTIHIGTLLRVKGNAINNDTILAGINRYHSGQAYTYVHPT